MISTAIMGRFEASEKHSFILKQKVFLSNYCFHGSRRKLNIKLSLYFNSTFIFSLAPSSLNYRLGIYLNVVLVQS